MATQRPRFLVTAESKEQLGLWDKEAATLGMSRSEYVLYMVEAARKMLNRKTVEIERLDLSVRVYNELKRALVEEVVVPDDLNKTFEVVLQKDWKGEVYEQVAVAVEQITPPAALEQKSIRTESDIAHLNLHPVTLAVHVGSSKPVHIMRFESVLETVCSKKPHRHSEFRQMQVGGVLTAPEGKVCAGCMKRFKVDPELALGDLQKLPDLRPEIFD